MNREKMAKKMVKDARFNLRKYLEDFPGSYPRIGIPFSKKTIEFVKENLNYFTEEAKKKNLKLEFAKDNSNFIFFEYLFL